MAKINYDIPPSPKEQEAYDLWKKEQQKDPELKRSHFLRKYKGRVNPSALYIALRKTGESKRYKKKTAAAALTAKPKKKKYSKQGKAPQTIVINEVASQEGKILFALVPSSQAQEFFKTAMGGQ